MDSYRKTAVIVGVLFLIGDIAGVLSVVVSGPILNAPNYLSTVSTNENQIVVGSFLLLVMGFALALIPVVAFPIFKRYNEVLALGYVVFRGALETVTSMATAVAWLLLIPLSQEYVKAGAPDVSSFHALGAVIENAAQLGTNLAAIVFPLGALLFYSLLYQSKLIPRWLSGWGLIGAVLYLAAGLYVWFLLISSFTPVFEGLALPLGVQEVVLAVWLIVKGFNPSEKTNLSTPA
jgi:hypothetical protein